MKMSFKAVASLLALAFIVQLLPAVSAQAEDLKYKRTVERYTVPDVVLINQDGKKVRLKELLSGDKPVVVDFIYATCTTICPVLSVSYLNLQRKLKDSPDSPRLISITIDPENDTPRIMKTYLKRYNAKPGWDFLTGSRADIDTVMKAFDA